MKYFLKCCCLYKYCLKGRNKERDRQTGSSLSTDGKGLKDRTGPGRIQQPDALLEFPWMAETQELEPLLAVSRILVTEI